MNFKISDHFELIEKDRISEYKTTSFLYKHKKTGAKVLFYNAPNPNLAFSIYFPTPVTDSRGISHILEHSVFDGSEKFPLRGNFEYLVNGSLASFLNAGTFQNKTMYYFASSFEKDFENVLDIYLDFVFFPKLEDNVFKREGFFYTKDSLGNYQFNGIVFNEMKDSLLSYDTQSFYGMMRHLFPDSTFSHLQGGDPIDIVDLDVEDLKNYHQKYYHPSNSYSILYGKLNQKKYFKKLNDYFDRFDRAETLKIEDFGRPKGVLTPTKVELMYQDYQDYQDDILSYSLAFSFENVSDEESLELYYLVDLLLRFKYSPLKRALEDSGLFKSLESYSYFDMYQTPVFYIQFRGILEKDTDYLKKIFFDTLKNLSKGIDKDLKETLLKNSEFYLKENFMTDGLGISWINSVSSTLMYGGNYNLSIKNLNLLKLYTKVSQGKKLEKMIKKHFLANPSFLEVIFKPSKDLINEYNENLNQKLATKLSKVTNFNNFDEEIKKFEDWKNEVVETPHYSSQKLLKASDIDAKPFKFDYEIHSKLLFTRLPVNDICYTRFYFDISKLGGINTDYMSLYLKVCQLMSTKNYHYTKFIQEITKYFAEMYVSYFPYNNYRTLDNHLTIRFGIKYLHRDFAKVKALLTEFIQNLVFDDKDHLRKLIKENLQDMYSSLDSYPGSFCDTEIMKNLSITGYIDSKFFGFDAFRFMKYLDENFDELYGTIVAELSNIHKKIFESKTLAFLGGDTKFEQGIVNDTMSLVNTLGLNIINKSEMDIYENHEFFILEKQNFYFQCNSDTNFNNLGLKYDNFKHEDRYKLLFLTKYLRKYLMEEVRIKGGAYGANSIVHFPDSILFFYSYSDPHVDRTYNIFENFINNYNIDSLTKNDFDKLKVKVLSRYKVQLEPREVFNVSTLNYIKRYSYEDQEKEIEGIRNLDFEDFKSFFKILQNPKYKVRMTASAKKIEEISGERFYEVKPLAT